ncbi:MAG TPA: DUF6134 family protein [Methylophilus sp.]
MQKINLLLSLCLFSTLVQSQEWNFDVFLDKQKIGTHSFKLNENNVLQSNAKFKVKVLFINAYDYLHSAEESWSNDCLTSLKANTVENKQVFDVSGTKTGQSFDVTMNKKSQQLPECTMTFAYWNPKILKQAKLLNPQNAEYLDTNIQSMGNETIQVKGRPIEATHYKLMGALAGKNKLNIDLWYNKNNEWVALKSTTPEGYEINYKLK